MNMYAPTVSQSSAGLYRTTDGLGVWPYRGKVAFTGVGHSPTLRRWDGDPQTTIGAWSILAIRKAIADAGVRPEDVDGLVFDAETSTGSVWPDGEPVPADFLAAFQGTTDPLDGFAKLSPEWLLKNMPELKNVKYVLLAPMCISNVMTAAIEAVGRGLTNVCVALKGWHNFAGRYYQNGPHMQPTISGYGKYGDFGEGYAGAPSYVTAMQFQRYLHKYGKTHDMMAPFVVNSRANGLLFPEGYWAQHRPTPITAEEYIASRWIAKPANLLDNDMPVQAAAAYVLTTAERAKDMQQPPVYVLGHAGGGTVQGGSYLSIKLRSTVETLEEAQFNAASTARRLYESAGVSASDIQFENCYDGFSLFHVFWVEGLGFAGVKEGECLDFFQTDISIHGPNPVSPSGGNIGGGRTRCWGWTDTIQQLQGRAGARQMKIDARIGVAGGPMPFWSNLAVFSKDPV
jgi:acetyl-CoA acetyltransferase